MRPPDETGSGIGRALRATLLPDDRHTLQHLVGDHLDTAVGAAAMHDASMKPELQSSYWSIHSRRPIHPSRRIAASVV